MIINTTLNFACFITWGFLLILPTCYLLVRWKDNYRILEGCFDDKAFELYYNLFKPSIIPPTGKTYRDLFKKYYHRSYGRRNFIIPIIIFSILSGIGMFSLDRSVLYFFNQDKSFLILPPIALSAFMGGYMWVGVDQILRLRIHDLTYHDINLWSFRLIISIPVGYSLSYFVKEPLGIPVAFFLGAFPMKSLLKYIRRITVTYLKLGDSTDANSSELLKIQGIGKRESERLQDEGLTNILQLAYYDPIDLTMRTSLDFLYILDIKSQALLWIYMGHNLDSNLRILGLRGSHETYILKNMLESKKKKYSDIAEENLKEISRKLNISSDSFKKTIQEVACDPHTVFLYEIWISKEFERCLEKWETKKHP